MKIRWEVVRLCEKGMGGLVLLFWGGVEGEGEGRRGNVHTADWGDWCLPRLVRRGRVG